jgi:hypothetical protein
MRAKAGAYFLPLVVQRISERLFLCCLLGRFRRFGHFGRSSRSSRWLLHHFSFCWRFLHSSCSLRHRWGHNCQSLHQAGFSPSSVILVDDALLGSLIQQADGFQHSGFRRLEAVGFESRASFLDRSTRRAAVDAVLYAPFLVLTVALDLRLDVCQITSSEIQSSVTGRYFT